MITLDLAGMQEGFPDLGKMYKYSHYFTGFFRCGENVNIFYGFLPSPYASGNLDY